MGSTASVDGRNSAPVDEGETSRYFQGFNHPFGGTGFRNHSQYHTLHPLRVGITGELQSCIVIQEKGYDQPMISMNFHQKEDH